MQTHMAKIEQNAGGGGGAKSVSRAYSIYSGTGPAGQAAAYLADMFRIHAYIPGLIRDMFISTYEHSFVS
jgi:hypothetical protein